MSGPAEILCSRCGTPFPKDKGKTAVTCVVCGQLRPDLDLTLDDDDEDLGAALGGGAGGGAAAAFSPGMGGGSAGNAGGAGGSGGMGNAGLGGMGSAPAIDTGGPVLRVAATASTRMEAPPEPPSAPFRVDQPYMAMHEGPPPLPEFGGRAVAADDRLLNRVGPVLLVVCPLAVGMVGGLNMMSRTEDFSAGTWYAVGAVFVVMVLAALFAGLATTGLLYVVRLRWTILLRAVFIAVTAAVGYYGMSAVPSHIQVRPDGLPGFVMRK